MPEKEFSKDFPFTKNLTAIAKRYFGIVSERLQNLPVDRYFYTLIVIAENEKQITQQMLAEKLGIDKVSMVRIIDYLSKKGCVKRRRNPNDRREHLLEVTAQGKEIIPHIKKAFYETNQAAFDGLQPEDIANFYHYITTISNNLSAIPAIDIHLKFNRISPKKKSEPQHENN